jgi:hypothetical protein
MSLGFHGSAGGPLATLFAAAALFAMSVSAGLATDMRQAGPMVKIAGDGGAIQAAGANVEIGGVASGVRAGGALVSVNATTTAGVTAAGARVSVSSKVGGNLKAAGAVVDVSGSVAGNTDIAGADVKVDLAAGGHLHVGGANITLAPGTDVKGDLAAYGALVNIGGHYAGKVNAGGAVVTFDGQADGSVEIAGSRVVIGPEAKIGGDLVVHSFNAPEIQQGAAITGTVTQITPSTWWSMAPWPWALGAGLAVAAGTIVAGLVLLLFGGQIFRVAVENVRHRPLSSFLFGILSLVLIPFVAALLAITVVGLSVAVAVASVLPFLIVFGHAVAAAGIAAGLLVRARGELSVGATFFMLVVGSVVLVAFGIVPWVGPAIVAIAIVLGIGAFTRTLAARLRHPSTAAPVP